MFPKDGWGYAGKPLYQHLLAFCYYLSKHILDVTLDNTSHVTYKHLKDPLDKGLEAYPTSFSM
jgi:hypothetical protein